MRYLLAVIISLLVTSCGTIADLEGKGQYPLVPDDILEKAMTESVFNWGDDTLVFVNRYSSKREVAEAKCGFVAPKTVYVKQRGSTEKVPVFTKKTPINGCVTIRERGEYLNVFEIWAWVNDGEYQITMRHELEHIRLYKECGLSCWNWHKHQSDGNRIIHY